MVYPALVLVRGLLWGYVRAAPGHLDAPRPYALRYPPQDQYGRDSGEYILKLVRFLECRLKVVMRPAMLPVSKTGPKVTTLKNQDFRYRYPSLTRNKWS